MYLTLTGQILSFMEIERKMKTGNNSSTFAAHVRMRNVVHLAGAALCLPSETKISQSCIDHAQCLVT